MKCRDIEKTISCTQPRANMVNYNIQDEGNGEEKDDDEEEDPQLLYTEVPGRNFISLDYIALHIIYIYIYIYIYSHTS
jgi:hypothetical protein